MKAAEGKETLVLDGPLDGFTAGEIQGLSDRRGEVDIPLLAGLAFDELDFSRETHGIYLVNQLDTRKQQYSQQKSTKMLFI
jgi:hypothetical protein